MIKVLSQDWENDLAGLFRSANEALMVVTPYFTSFGVDLLVKNASAGLLSRGRITFLTDLSPANICSGAARPAALIPLQAKSAKFQVFHLASLHAKLYLADDVRAIVTSGNLTAGGLVHNYEYGLLLEVKDVIIRIRRDVDQLVTLGTEMTGERLLAYAKEAESLVATYERKLGGTREELTRDFEQAFRDAGDRLIALRLAGGPITTIFERTVLYLLRKYGPLSTYKMHPLVKAIHPELCDDSVDRVINGQHFGKKWKHAVRRAQSHLKDRGEIERVQGLWRIKSSKVEHP